MTKKNHIVIVLAITLLIVTPIVAVLFAASNLSTVDIGDGVWQLQPKLTGFTINDASAPSVGLYSQVFDPDGVGEVFTAPAVLAELTNLRQSATAPVTLNDKTVYLVEFDLGLKTRCVWTGNLGHEGVSANCRVDFKVDVQRGIFDESPDAMVLEIRIKDYTSGLTRVPGMTLEEAQAYVINAWSDGSIGPVINPVEDAGVPLMTGGTTTSAEASVGCLLRPGYQLHLQYLFGIPTGPHHFDKWDVFAKYTMEVEIAVPQGEAPPQLNPFAAFLRILQDFVGSVKTWGEAWLEAAIALLTVWVPIIAIGIFVIVLFFIYIRYKRK